MNRYVVSVLSVICFVLPLFSAGNGIVFEGGLFTLLGLILIVAACTGAYYTYKGHKRSENKI